VLASVPLSRLDHTVPLVLPGPASLRQAFVSVHDAADGLVAAIDAPLTGAVDVGGPAPSAANVMGMNLFMATTETAWDTARTTAELGVGPLRTVRQVLTEKAGLVSGG
jgi:hypothetical protein